MQLTTVNTVLLATFALAVTAVSGKGINCEGSSACRVFVQDPSYGGKGHGSNQLASLIHKVRDGRLYTNGQKIACIPGSYWIPGKGDTIEISGGICASLKGNLPFISGAQLKPLADHLVKHGCKGCGSVPVTYPKDNNINNGMLTFNFITGADCEGLC